MGRMQKFPQTRDSVFEIRGNRDSFHESGEWQFLQIGNWLPGEKGGGRFGASVLIQKIRKKKGKKNQLHRVESKKKSKKVSTCKKRGQVQTERGKTNTSNPAYG